MIKTLTASQGAVRGWLVVQIDFLLFILDHLLELLGATALFLDDPIVHAIVFVLVLAHQAFEETSQVVVIRLLLKHKIATVLEVLGELLGSAAAELLDCGLDLFFFDLVVLIVFVLASETLPGKRTLQEIQQDVANRLKIITSSLLNSNMRVDRSVASSACQALVVTVWNVLACLWVSVPFRESEVNHVNNVTLIVDAH